MGYIGLANHWTENLPETTALKVLFMIPFVSKKYADDFARASEMLSATIDSIRQQTIQDFEIMVISNDPPDIDMRRIIFAQTELTIDDPSRHGRRMVDKERKIHWGLVEARTYDPHYVMLFDADDLVNCRLVEYVVGHELYDGFIVRLGYAYETGSDRLRRSFRFHRSCGSNYLFRFDKDQLPDQHSDYRSPNYRRWWPVRAHNKNPATDFQRLGYRYKYLPFFAVVYRRWDGSARRRAGFSVETIGSFKLGAVVKRIALERKLTPALAREFGIKPIPSADKRGMPMR